MDKNSSGIVDKNSDVTVKPKPSKIAIAENLAKTIPENPRDNSHIDKALRIYKELCMNMNLHADDRFEALVSLCKHIPAEGVDMINRWRDVLPFVKDDPVRLKEMIGLLVRLTKCPSIISHERLYTCVTLYNRAHMDVCYDCFADVAIDTSVLVNYRIEAARYLFGSENDDYKQQAQECLLEVIESMSYPCEFRYAVIAGFISRTGISTMLNATKIRVPYDEEFVYGMQTVFFYNENNKPRYRILSGQHILDMNCVTEDEKQDVGDIIIGLARNKDYDENLRADAADVILRLGTPDQRGIARELIADMGQTIMDAKGSIADRSRSVYSDSQNVHNEKIHECVNKFIDMIMKETHIAVRPYHEIHSEVSELIRETKLSPEKRFAAYKALNRINIDTATFTKRKVSMAEIFTHIWLRIQRYESESQRKTLYSRLLEEMMEMSDSCSSGHAARLVNVLSVFEASLAIDFSEQIRANINGRMNARIRDIKDVDKRSAVAMGMLADADADDKKIYITFVKESLEDLKKELRKEFVGGGYIPVKEFDICFELGAKQWKA